MSTPRVRIVQLDLATISALAEGDLEGARPGAAVELTPYLVEEHPRHVWSIRAEQLATTPQDAAWVTGVIVDEGSGRTVGAGGFHAAPDAEGMVEVGYGIDPQHRRQGFARATLEALIERARREPGAHTLRATISPTNEPSLGLIRQFPFAEVGEQWDEEDGLEIIYELPVSDAR